MVQRRPDYGAPDGSAQLIAVIDRTQRVLRHAILREMSRRAMTAKERIDPHTRDETGAREAEANGPAVEDPEAASDDAKGSPAES